MWLTWYKRFVMGFCNCEYIFLCNNFKKGKKVLVPSITFSATAAAVLYCGLTPVFVDINQDDLNMNVEDLKKKYR